MSRTRTEDRSRRPLLRDELDRFAVRRTTLASRVQSILRRLNPAGRIAPQRWSTTSASTAGWDSTAATSAALPCHRIARSEPLRVLVSTRCQGEPTRRHRHGRPTQEWGCRTLGIVCAYSFESVTVMVFQAFAARNVSQRFDAVQNRHLRGIHADHSMHSPRNACTWDNRRSAP